MVTLNHECSMLYVSEKKEKKDRLSVSFFLAAQRIVYSTVQNTECCNGDVCLHDVCNMCKHRKRGPLLPKRGAA